MELTQTAGTRSAWTRGMAILLIALIAICAWLLLRATPGRAAACSAEVNYTGPENGEWGKKENWSGGSLPTAAQTVCIPEGKGTIRVVKGSAEALAKNVQAGSGLLIEGEATLKIADNESFSGRSRIGELTIQEKGVLAMVDAPLNVRGNAVIDGEIQGPATVGDNVEYEDPTGTMTGNGVIGPNFAGVKGKLSPGTVGTPGTMTFKSHVDSGGEFTWVIDLTSNASFDRLLVTGGNEAFLGEALVEGVLHYSAALHQKWQFMSSTICVSCGKPSKGFEIVTAGESGNGSLELIEVPAVGPQPPLLEVGALDTQAEVKVTGTSNGTGTVEEYAVHIEPGNVTDHLHSSGSSASGRVTSLTNCVTYTATATVKTSVGTSGPSTAVQFTPHGAAGCSTGGGGNTKGGGGSSPGGTEEHVASTPKAVEELALGCSGKQLVLNDVYIRGARVAIEGSAAKSLAGKTVKILFNEKRQVATATVQPGGQFATTAPLPPARIRNAVSTRYSATLGSLRSLHLKLTRRLLLEPPKASGSTVTLSGIVTPPLTKPAAPVVVEEQLECGRTTIAKRFTPPASGRFHITLSLPAGAKAAIFRLTSSVAANSHATKHGFNTFSLPLPLTIG